jgi:integrase
MAGHTTMPPRTQKTPYGDVTLTSRWKRESYALVATGPITALRWMFPNHPDGMEQVSSQSSRHVFAPSATPIRVERDLRRVCAKFQSRWDELLQDHEVATYAPAMSTITRPETLKQAYEHHQVHYAGLLGPRTREQYPSRMKEWFAYLGPDIRLDEVSAEVILGVRAQMKKDHGSSNTTINGKVSTLKKVLNMAHRKGWVITAPWRDVPNLRMIKERTRYWTVEQAAIAFAVARKDAQPERATLMLTLGIHLGIRKNEAVHLRWSDLDLDRLHPTTGLPSPICLIQQRDDFTTKTYENRKVPISAECKRLLLECRPADSKPDDYILDPERHHRKRGGTKRVYRYDCVKIWKRVLKAAMTLGNPAIEFKEMRHTFACNCLRNGHPVERVARWLGHKDPRMVRQHYAFLLDYDDDTGLKFIDDAG